MAAAQSVSRNTNWTTDSANLTLHNRILTLPFRRTQPASLSGAISQYISTKYDQHPDMFTRDLQAVDDLRRDAVTVQEPHASGIQRLQAYAAQLVWMSGRFPVDIGVDFTWYASLGYNISSPRMCCTACEADGH